MSLDYATACLAALPVPLSDGTAPEWIMLLPAGSIRTADNRGPYTIPDASKLAAQSLRSGDRLPICENHSTDLAAPKGGPSPARGWIVELQARADGVWGKVEWTAAGAGLLAERAYRHVSPVITHLADGTITSVLRASLTNTPNLRGLAALHSETSMDLMTKLREALGLTDAADETAVLAHAKTMRERWGALAEAAGLAKEAKHDAILAEVKKMRPAATHAQLAKAVGLGDDAEPAAVLQAVQTLAGVTKDATAVPALQAELASVTTQLNAVRSERATEKASAFVDGAIKAGKVGVRALRDHYIAMHALDPARVEKEIGALPALGPSGATVAPPAKDGKPALQSEQAAVARLLNISPDDYQKTLAAEAVTRQEAY